MEMFNKFMLGIRVIRVFTGMTQKDVAEKAGIKESTYSRFEQQSTDHNPRLDTLIGLASAVGMTIEEVLEFVDSLNIMLTEKKRG